MKRIEKGKMLASMEKSAQNMAIVDALVRLGVPLHSTIHYGIIARALSIDHRVVRRTHESNWPVCRRMMELERENIRIKAEYEDLKNLVFPADADYGTVVVDGNEVMMEPRLVNTEREGFKAAIDTLERWKEIERGKVA